jgi:hypothetical protein
MAGAAEPNNVKGRQQEEPIANIQTPFSNDLSSPAKFDIYENHAFWKLRMHS